MRGMDSCGLFFIPVLKFLLTFVDIVGREVTEPTSGKDGFWDVFVFRRELARNETDRCVLFCFYLFFQFNEIRITTIDSPSCLRDLNK